MLKTFTRPESLSNLGRILGSEGVREESLRHIQFGEENVLYYDSFPYPVRNPFRTVLGYKRSQWRNDGDGNVSIEYETLPSEAVETIRAILQIDWRWRVEVER